MRWLLLLPKSRESRGNSNLVGTRADSYADQDAVQRLSSSFSQASGSIIVIILAALSFGVAAGYYYWRVRTAWREMRNQQWTPLWPPQDSHSEGGD